MPLLITNDYDWLITSCSGLHKLVDAFLPLDVAVASRAVFVIVSGGDGQAGGRKRIWSQLNNSKR